MPTTYFSFDSGDDHDVCEYSHPNGVREVTVKTFSMALEVSQPGFQILSLVPADPLEPSLPTHADMACNLPDQLAIYNHIYFPLALITVFYLLFVLIKRSVRWKAPPKSINLSGIGTGMSMGMTTPSISRKPSFLNASMLKSPRAGSTHSLQSLQPINTTIRRPSRSVPPSPLGSPKQLYLDLEEAEAGYPSEPSYYFSRSSNDLLESPTETDDLSPSQFLPVPATASNSSVGLGIFGTNLPSPSRPGLPRRPTRMDSKKLASAAALGEEGTLANLKEIVRDFEKTLGLGRRFWGLCGGEEGLVAKWVKECVGVFWPCLVVYSFLNLYYYL